MSGRRGSLRPDARPAAGGRMLRDVPLRARIALGILFCGLIPLFLLALVGFDGARAELKAMAFGRLDTVRDIKITVLQKFYFERRADVRVFAANPAIARAVEEMGRAGGPPAAPRDEPFLRALLREYQYHDLFLMRPDDGAVLFSLRSGAGAAARPAGLDEAWRAARSAEIGISDLRLEPDASGRPAQYLAAPIRDGGRTVGVVAVQLAPDAIDSILLERAGLGETGASYLGGPDGRRRAPLRPARPELDPATAGLCALGGAGNRILERPGGRRVLASFAPVGLPGLRWTIFAEIEEGEIDAQIARALNGRIVGLIGASTLLLAALAFLIGRGLGRAVRGVIDDLRRPVRDVLSGKPATRTRPEDRASDFRPVLAEINALIDAFEEQSAASRRLESHIRDGQRLEVIGSLAGGVSHDFNNLLAHMRALAHILEEEARAEGRDTARLEDLKLALRRGSELVGQILTFSRPGQDRRQVFDLREAAAESLRLLQAALPAGVRLDFEPGPDALPVSGDRSQIHQIVLNLCVNAIQALQGRGGRVGVRLGSEEMEGIEAEGGAAGGRLARLTVEDDGPGMSEEIRRRIFEPFFTTKPPEQGSGLGLSVVAGIVLSLGGLIEVDSRPGEGSRFEIYIPLAAAAERAGRGPAC